MTSQSPQSDDTMPKESLYQDAGTTDTPPRKYKMGRGPFKSFTFFL